MNSLSLLIAVGTIGVQSSGAIPRSLEQYVYPLAKPIQSPRVEINFKAAPEAERWAKSAKSVVEEWFPEICRWLATENFKAPRVLKLTFRPDIDPPAYCAGNEITIKSSWIAAHPDDLGMVIHELTHAIQAYPDSPTTPGWLVEGIADYTRWWRYQPDSPRPKINFKTANYTDAYRVTAYWLAWVSQRYDERLVPSLDRKMRNKQDPMPVFQELTGKKPDELWREFAAAVGNP